MSKFFKVNVSTVIFNDTEQILIQKRSEEEEVFPGLWGIPGGTVEMTDASLIDALRREVREEVSVDIDNIEFIKENVRAKEMYGMVYIVFTSKLLSGIAKPDQDTEEVKWIEKDELDQYKFTPTTKETIKEIYERKSTNNSI
ncbi:MAG: hypothetical protein A2556_00485 [Candidatus Vogelbacteria bacterium RIFOXYD2_FULL_44_9]|uniref:ADP-ribose pyrophosphatase n=2 Tax=Patescibacteria group TaxID=1783273 RepID=A0A0G0X3M7_9BACT|nr:MAG: ADP-ribose pyrophosphatase [Candidatus Woesebacteria bacterium GW2011_GWA1_41_13b]OHA60865.1 MAG: hypothetical protein A2556_00485 [Candidatus Vogelbacteria bacterium RIFOXYD2_FULL_44_9]